MGFFSDLKEDLNQAVNELMPGEKENLEQAGKDESLDSVEIPDDEETLKQLADLEQILQNLDVPKKGDADHPKQAVADSDSMSYESLGNPLEDFEEAGNKEEENKEEIADKPDAEREAAEKEENQKEKNQEETPKEETQEAAEKESLDQAEKMPAEEAKPEFEGVGLGMAISLSEEDSKMVKNADDDMKETMGEFQDAVAALKDSVEVQKAKEQSQEEIAKEQAQDQDNLEEELRATFGAKEGEETVEDYLHEEAIRTGAEIIDKSWVLDLKGMETMDETAIITAGMRVKGDILSNGSADISGEVIGNVQIKGKLNITGKVTGNSKAQEIFADSARVQGDMISDNTVKVGVDSVVIGNIEATSAVIAGAVKGTIDVKGPVILDATAVVLGNVRAKSMQINNGARIEGMCVLCYAEQSAAKFFEEQAAL